MPFRPPLLLDEYAGPLTMRASVAGGPPESRGRPQMSTFARLKRPRRWMGLATLPGEQGSLFAEQNDGASAPARLALHVRRGRKFATVRTITGSGAPCRVGPWPLVLARGEADYPCFDVLDLQAGTRLLRLPCRWPMAWLPGERRRFVAVTSAEPSPLHAIHPWTRPEGLGDDLSLVLVDLDALRMTPLPIRLSRGARRNWSGRIAVSLDGSEFYLGTARCLEAFSFVDAAPRWRLEFAGDPDVVSHGFEQVVLSSCGTHLLAVRGPASLEPDRHVVLVDPATGEQRHGWTFEALFGDLPRTDFGHDRMVHHAVAHPTGWFALGGGRGYVAHIDPSTASVRAYLLPRTTVSALAFTGDGAELLVNDQYEAIRRVPLLDDERGA